MHSNASRNSWSRWSRDASDPTPACASRCAPWPRPRSSCGARPRTWSTPCGPPKLRCRWGEMQLEGVVEAAGMTEHVDYATQVSVTGDGPVQRPDLVVRL